jgi:hypothetical protein
MAFVVLGVVVVVLAVAWLVLPRKARAWGERRREQRRRTKE